MGSWTPVSGGCATLCMLGLVSQIHFLHKLENKLTSRSRASHLTTREVDVLSLSHLKKREKKSRNYSEWPTWVTCQFLDCWSILEEKHHVTVFSECAQSRESPAFSPATAGHLLVPRSTPIFETPVLSCPTFIPAPSEWARSVPHPDPALCFLRKQLTNPVEWSQPDSERESTKQSRNHHGTPSPP